jgi:hypothetical protein
VGGESASGGVSGVTLQTLIVRNVTPLASLDRP